MPKKNYKNELKKLWVAYLKELKAYEKQVKDYIQYLQAQEEGGPSTQDDGGTNPPGGPPPPPGKP